MINSLLKSIISKYSLYNIEKRIKKSFLTIKGEFNEHLDAINENTSEIQANYEILLKLESRVDKIEANLAEIDSFIKQFRRQQVYFLDDEKNSFVIEPLNDDEKRVVRAMYELETEGIKVTYAKLSEIIGISTSLLREFVLSLISKGVPIMKHYLNQSTFLSLEPNFRELQTTRNIMGL